MADQAVSNSEAGMRWHVVVGVLGIVYGVAGILLHTLTVVGLAFSGTFMRMAGVENFTTPPFLFWSGVLTSGVLLILGVVLVVGSSLLLMKRPRGAGLMRFWAGARIAFVVIGLGVSLATIKPQIDFQTQVLEAQREILRERGGDPNQIPIPDAAEAERRGRMIAVAISVLVTAFPLFVGFLLTSRKKKDEIATWTESVG